MLKVNNQDYVDLFPDMPLEIQDACFAILYVMSHFVYFDNDSGYGYEMDEQDHFFIAVDDLRVHEGKDFVQTAYDFFKPEKDKYGFKISMAVFSEFENYASINGEDIREKWNEDFYRNYRLSNVIRPLILSMYKKMNEVPVDFKLMIEELISHAEKGGEHYFDINDASQEVEVSVPLKEVLFKPFNIILQKDVEPPKGDK